MELRTEVTVNPLPFSIGHKDKVMLMGSCFTNNINAKLIKHGFETFDNPYGITFNPLSLSKQLKEIIEYKKYTDEDISEANGRFFSFQHHSSFSNVHFYDLLVNINESITKARLFLKEAKVLFISIGTAWSWGHIEKSCIVNNCHKVPAKEFDLVLGECRDINKEFQDVFEMLNHFNPDLQIVFTISPVRHLRNGAVNNSRSKSVLISSVHNLVDEYSQAHYFPSYEILMDDLRDYRFYNDDMVHPSDKALEYVWSKFGDAFFEPKTKEANQETAKVRAMLDHRPFNPESEEYHKFLDKLEVKKSRLKKEYDISL